MPYLEMFEVQENEVYTQVEITEEQAKEYKEYQKILRLSVFVF